MSTPLPPPPQHDAAPASGGRIEPRVANAGAGATWWLAGWRLFARSVVTWFSVAIVYAVAMWLLGKLPMIGEAATWLLSPVFIGGIMSGCDAMQRGERLRVSHLFEGFKRQHFVPLLLVGVFNLLVILAAVVIGMVVIVAALGTSDIESISRAAADPMRLIFDIGFESVLIGAVALIAGTMITMANWFAPTLVVLREVRPAAAMLTSFRACLRNWAAFLVYGAIGIAIIVPVCIAFVGLAFAAGFGTLIAIIDGTAGMASVGVGLGLLGVAYLAGLIALGVVASASSYASYRDTLADDQSQPATPAPH